MVDTSLHATQGIQRTEYVGVVAEDLQPNSVTISVHLPQMTPALKGGVGVARSTVDVKVKSTGGASQLSTASTKNYIKCDWYGESNVKYPPTVRKGEQVIVFREGDSDVWRWSAMGRNPELRQTEVHRVEFSATTKKAAENTDNNSYYFEVNTTAKTVTMKISQDNGEPFGWVFNLDAGKGILQVGNTAGDLVSIDGNTKTIQASNSSGTCALLSDKNLILVAPEDIILRAGRQVVVDAPTFNHSTSSGDGVTQMNVKALAINATDGVTISGTTIGIEGAVKATGSVITGPLQAEGISTGSSGSSYQKASQNIGDGSGSNPKQSPETVSPDSGGRHATAWEDMVPIIEAIATTIGRPDLLPLINAAKMNKMKGD
jgi:hypothetical protein